MAASWSNRCASRTSRPVRILTATVAPVVEIAGAVDRAHPARAGLGEELEPPGDDPLDHIGDFGRKTVTLST